MSLISLIIGFLFGVISSTLIGGYLLMTYGQNELKQKEKKEKIIENNLKEKDLSEEELQVLNDALKILKGEVEEIPAPELHPSEEHAPTEIKEMETAFLLSSQNSKQRQKHLKGLTR